MNELRENRRLVENVCGIGERDHVLCRIYEFSDIIGLSNGLRRAKFYQQREHR